MHWTVLQVVGVFTEMETQTMYLYQHWIPSVLLNFLSVTFTLCDGVGRGGGARGWNSFFIPYISYRCQPVSTWVVHDRGASHGPRPRC